VTYKAEILLGRIAKVYGRDGTVTIRLEKKFIEKITVPESVFLEVEGKLVPFFISWSDYSDGDILRVRFEGYESISKAGEFTGCRVFLTEGDDPGNEDIPDYHLLIGYTLILSDNTRIGTIKELIENPEQLLAVVQPEKGGKILVPLHEELIEGLDRKKKIIRMDLPEGLIDLNQS
jgi:16S rRNA processing protein RimM